MSTSNSIKQLPTHIINRIAAGEVIERPASIIKELVDNAIDAGATRLEIRVIAGGINHIKISDNGHGVRRGEIALALTRHATSKLQDDELVNIDTFGFRGEALPSIAAVSKLTLTTWHQDDRQATKATANQLQQAIMPEHGTIVEVEDLFYNIPARLKFLKSETAEWKAICDVLKTMAIVHHHVTMQIYHNNNLIYDYASSDDKLDRIRQIFGESIAKNIVKVTGSDESYDLEVYAYVGLPTFHKANRLQQWLYINNRHIKEKTFAYTLSLAYRDVLPHGRHPFAIVFLDVPKRFIDINVHPAKIEARFYDIQAINRLIRKTIEHNWNNSLDATKTAISSLKPDSSFGFTPPTNYHNYEKKPLAFDSSSYQKSGATTNLVRSHTRSLGQPPAVIAEENNPRVVETPQQDAGFLGYAKGQIKDTYIVSEAEDGLIITDQHAAHERLVYEKLKRQYDENIELTSKTLLIPQIIELSAEESEVILNNSHELKGFIIEKFGTNAISIKSIPAIINDKNINQLIKNIAEMLLEHGTTKVLEQHIHHIISTIACHGSIRAGRRMTTEEMNTILRDMEQTPKSGQCNHGRPTYVKLNWNEVEKLFGRK
jgi:DNA mismatch repair protein MutL